MKTAPRLLTCLMVALIAGCASAPPPKPKAAPAAAEVQVMSVLELTACDKPYAFFVVTSDGMIHPALADELSKEQMAGIDAVASALPEGNAGEMTIPCIPSLKTHLQD